MNPRLCQPNQWEHPLTMRLELPASRPALPSYIVPRRPGLKRLKLHLKKRIEFPPSCAAAAAAAGGPMGARLSASQQIRRLGIPGPAWLPGCHRDNRVHTGRTIEIQASATYRSFNLRFGKQRLALESIKVKVLAPSGARPDSSSVRCPNVTQGSRHLFSLAAHVWCALCTLYPPSQHTDCLGSNKQTVSLMHQTPWRLHHRTCQHFPGEAGRQEMDR